eukprot:gene24458-48473_t
MDHVLERFDAQVETSQQEGLWDLSEEELRLKGMTDDDIDTIHTQKVLLRYMTPKDAVEYICD